MIIVRYNGSMENNQPNNNQINYPQITEKLVQLASDGGWRRKKTKENLLMPIKDILLSLREQKVPYAQIAITLEEGGISISEATLRSCINKWPKPKAKRSSSVKEPVKNL